MTPEEIDKRLSDRIQGAHDHIVLMDTPDDEPLQCAQMSWEEFFMNLDSEDFNPTLLIVLKREIGPFVIWTEK